MGTFTVRLEVGNPARRQFVEVEALVDAGATYTVLPRDMLLTLGVEVVERLAFQLADERLVEYEVGEARIRLDGRERTAVVVFGPQGAKALLGATTLELFNLAVDPVRRCLVPVPGLLKQKDFALLLTRLTGWCQVGTLHGALASVCEQGQGSARLGRRQDDVAV